MTIAGDIQEYIEENIHEVVAPTQLEYVPYETENPNFSTAESNLSVTVKTISTNPDANKEDQTVCIICKLYYLEK